MADEQKPKPKIVTVEVLEYCLSQLKPKFVRVEAGKGLSTNDFTNELRTKLINIHGDDYEVATQEDIDYVLNDVFGNDTSDTGSGEGESSGDSPVDDDV